MDKLSIGLKVYLLLFITKFVMKENILYLIKIIKKLFQYKVMFLMFFIQKMKDMVITLSCL